MRGAGDAGAAGEDVHALRRQRLQREKYRMSVTVPGEEWRDARGGNDTAAAVEAIKRAAAERVAPTYRPLGRAGGFRRSA